MSLTQVAERCLPLCFEPENFRFQFMTNRERLFGQRDLLRKVCGELSLGFLGCFDSRPVPSMHVSSAIKREQGLKFLNQPDKELSTLRRIFHPFNCQWNVVTFSHRQSALRCADCWESLRKHCVAGRDLEYFGSKITPSGITAVHQPKLAISEGYALQDRSRDFGDSSVR